jgi:hypothetical protein
MSGAFPLSHPLHRSRTLPKFLMARRETQAFVCTGLSATPEQILLWFPQCSSLEATFLGRASPFGVETRASMIWLGNLANHACLRSCVLYRCPACSSTVILNLLLTTSACLRSQTVADVHWCFSFGASTVLAHPNFSVLLLNNQYDKNTKSIAG